MPDERLQTMLCLAALTYRRYSSWIPGRLHDLGLRKAVNDGLKTFEPLPSGNWRLVWGPESYRAPLSLVDDAMMFVVRQEANPPRYVIAVRGTNPVSAFDWVIGDLWVSTPVAWPNEPDDRSSLSMSTALGLIILLSMRSESPGDGLEKVWSRLNDAADQVGDAIGGAGAWSKKALGRLAPLDNVVREALKKVLPKPLPLPPAPDDEQPHDKEDTKQPHDERENKQPDDEGDDIRPDDEELIRCVRNADQFIPSFLTDLKKTIGALAHEALFAHLSRTVAAQSKITDGHDLVTFLKGVVESEGRVEIVVTGHSKGGALAPALALWLEEKRETDWDPSQRASIHCVAFAGPSPGNNAFAERFNTKLGDRFDRVVNEQDIVPHAWETGTLGRINSLYDPEPRCPRALAELLNSIAKRVGPLAYAHLGGRLTPLKPALNAKRKSFAAQMVHQHLDGYFEAMEMKLTTAHFFNPFG
jgi:hypothetical protein